MSYTWFKLHHDLPGDIKLRRFTPQEKWAWVALLCLASQSHERGVIDADDEDIADYCEFSTTQDWLYYRDKLIAKGMAEIGPDGNLHILHWEQRQYDKPSDRPEAVRERVKRHREKKKNAAVTPCNADVTPQIRLDTDSDTEQNRSELPLSGECEGGGANFSNSEFEPTEQGTTHPVQSSPIQAPPDRQAAQFMPKPWRGEQHQLEPAFCDYVGKLFPGDTDKHPRTKGRNHVLNLERSGDPYDYEKLSGYWQDYQSGAATEATDEEVRRKALISKLAAFGPRRASC